MKASLFTTLCLAMALAACGQTGQETGVSVEANVTADGTDVSANSDTVDSAMNDPRFNAEERAILELCVDANGQFDYAIAREAYEGNGAKARALRNLWSIAFSDAVVRA